MIFFIQTLVVLVLSVSATVAYLPILLHQRLRNIPSRVRPILKPPEVWLVESSKGEWFLQGKPLTKVDLTRRLKNSEQPKVHYLPSDALRMQEVSRSMNWLRSLAPGSVVLEMRPPNRW